MYMTKDFFIVSNGSDSFFDVKSIVKNSVNEIIKDKQEYIWIATNDGVLKYDPTRRQI